MLSDLLLADISTFLCLFFVFSIIITNRLTDPLPNLKHKVIKKLILFCDSLISGYILPDFYEPPITIHY